uniref:Major pollen allergen Ole e 10-like n=1 Tax=Elaeis guineensis var. tenera TaxID=51953 RepID=A0A6I9QFQ3_ELAGV|nr:major pollen allergen Ole e 10-like [Elaeis guineensis]
MAKSVLLLPVFYLFLLLLSVISGITSVIAQAQLLSQKTWCVAKPSTIELALKDNIQFACNNINCSPIQIGGVCFYPDTTISHASVVMNIYYQANGRNYWNCDFGGSGMISFGDPSYGNCKYD